MESLVDSQVGAGDHHSVAAQSRGGLGHECGDRRPVSWHASPKVGRRGPAETAVEEEVRSPARIAQTPSDWPARYQRTLIGRLVNNRVGFDAVTPSDWSTHSHSFHVTCAMAEGGASLWGTLGAQSTPTNQAVVLTGRDCASGASDLRFDRGALYPHSYYYSIPERPGRAREYKKIINKTLDK
eukprot:1191331-Prorocentrum_minimum.AAC.1